MTRLLAVLTLAIGGLLAVPTLPAQPVAPAAPAYTPAQVQLPAQAQTPALAPPTNHTPSPGYTPAPGYAPAQVQLPPAQAQPPGQAPSTASPATRSYPMVGAPPEKKTLQLPLRRLINPKDTINLRTSSATYTVFLPKSARFQMDRLAMHLEFTNSIALLTDRSVLRVVINDIIVAQYHLDRDNPFRAVDFEIPTRLLKDGFNRVQFMVAQHYTLKCEDPSAPELYTEINPDRSFFSATGSWKAVPSRLSYLRWWIDEKLWMPYEFNIVIPGAATVSDLHLAYGAIITQGVGLALNNQQFRVHVSNALRPGMDNIVVGTANEVSGYLTATEVGSINGGFLAIRPMPDDDTRCVIIISGRNEQEVGQTAFAFGLVNYPLPDSQFASIGSLNLPTSAAFVRNAPLTLPGIYGFRQLNYETRTIKGWNTGGYQMRVYMPGDISHEDPSNIELRLHFVYGAAMRKDSTFNVLVNHQFQTAIRLSNEEGAMHTNHRLYLPIPAFQPGLNTVDLVPVMVPLFSDQCQILQDENLLFTLYDDSEFVLPKAMRKARLPSFGLFSQTTYPYISSPDGSETAICVTSQDPDTVCAAWTILGKMAQISGALLHRSEISFRLPRSQKSLLVVGPRDSIPPEVLSRAPISPLEVGRIRYVVSVTPKPQRVAISPVEEFLNKIRGVPNENAEPEPPAVAEINLTSDLAEETVAIQYESPFHLGFPVTVVTAGNPGRLLEGAQALEDRQVWDNLSGDLAVWSARPDSLALAKVGPDFIFKSTSLMSRMSVRFDANPWLMAVIVIGVLAILGAITAFAIRRRDKAEDTGG